MTFTKAEMIKSIQNQFGLPQNKSRDIFESFMRYIRILYGDNKSIPRKR